MGRQFLSFAGARKDHKPVSACGVTASTLVKSLPWMGAVFFIISGQRLMQSIQQKNHVSGAHFHESCYPKLGLKPLKTRELFGELVEEHGFKTGIEIGVKKGDFAKIILDQWKSCTEYHLVDVWSRQENYEDVANVADSDHEKFYAETKEKLKKYENKTHFHRMLSTEAAKKFKNGSIDFIYVDARHDYCGVKEDIESYWDVLKPGGIMAGHDYNENSEIRGQDWGLCGDGSRNEMAVKGAVNDFFLPKGLTITVTYYRENNFMSWSVQKPLC